MYDYNSGKESDAAVKEALASLLRYAENLPKEKTEKDLDKEIERFFHKVPLRAGTPPLPDEYIDEKTFDLIARHFAEYGMRMKSPKT